jgi:hypothetical protein
VLWTCVTVFLVGWIAATVVVFAAGKRLCEPGMPRSYRLFLSVAAGFVWPLLLVGVVELSSMAVYSSAEHSLAMMTTDAPYPDLDIRQTLCDVTPIR